MGIVVIIGILIAVILYLIILGSGKARTLRDETKHTENGIITTSKRITELIEERDQLSRLRKQEVHNNYILTIKNRELQDFKSEVIDIMNDKTLLMINKIDEINKLLSSDKDNNTIR